MSTYWCDDCSELHVTVAPCPRKQPTDAPAPAAVPRCGAYAEIFHNAGCELPAGHEGDHRGSMAAASTPAAEPQPARPSRASLEEHISTLEAEVAALRADGESWRRVAERLEAEKQTALAQVKELELKLSDQGWALDAYYEQQRRESDRRVGEMGGGG